MESSKMMNGQKCANDTQTEGTHNSTAEENKLHESNIGFAEEIFLQLGMSDQKFKIWNQKMDNLERKEANCCQCRFDSVSPLEISSISFTKEEKSLATESTSASSEVSQDEMESNNYEGENRDADCDGRLLCLNNLKKHLCYLDLSSPSETFSSASDAEESIMKDEIFSLVKHSRDSTGDEMKDVPKRDQLKKELRGTDTEVTENSQMKLHYFVAEQLDDFKSLIKTNQELAEELQTKLLQIWCKGSKHEAEELQDDDLSEGDTENPVTFSGEESSVDTSGQDVVKKQQNTTIKTPKRDGQTPRTSRHVEISHSAGHWDCPPDPLQAVQLQVGGTRSGDVGADLEEISEQYCEVLHEQITSSQCNIPKTDPVDQTSNNEQLVISWSRCSAPEMQVHNQNILLAKDAVEDSAVIVKERLKKIQWHLSEIEEDNRNIHFQIIKLNADYRQIQEYHQCMTCDGKTFANQAVDRNSTAAQNEETLCVIDKLEKRIQVALNNLSEIKTEKISLEQQFQALKEVYNSQKEARIAEREHLTEGYGRLTSTVEVLQVQSGAELAHTEKLNQQIAALISENHRLQQVTEAEMRKSKLALQDAKKWKKNCDKLTAKHQEKEKQSSAVIQMLKMEMDALKETSKKKERKIKQNMKMLANVILDMKLVHSNLSAKGPSDKGDCANSTCVKKTSQILSKIDGILSSMEEIFVCQKSNTCSSSELPFGDSDTKGVGDLKERVPVRDDRSRRLNHEIWLQECGAIDSEVRESWSRPAGPRKISKRESAQKRIIKRMEECKMLAAENVKLHNCVQELVCKQNTLTKEKQKCWKHCVDQAALVERVNGFNKIIQYAEQRLQMNNLHILRLEKKNSLLLVTLNKMASKKELRGSFSAESTSNSSRASEKLHCSWRKENNFSETGVCSAKGLEMCDYQNQKECLTLDNPEFAEGICSPNSSDKTSQQYVYSNSRRKDKLCFEAETISTLSDASQDDGDHSSNEEKNDTDWNSSNCGNDVDKIIPKEDILNKKTANVVENEAVNQRKSQDEFKLLVAENIELHTCVNELQSKMDGLNEIVQIADQRLRMFNMQIIGLEKKNSALVAALNKKIKKRTSS